MGGKTSKHVFVYSLSTGSKLCFVKKKGGGVSVFIVNNFW